MVLEDHTDFTDLGIALLEDFEEFCENTDVGVIPDPKGVKDNDVTISNVHLQSSKENSYAKVEVTSLTTCQVKPLAISSSA